MTVQDLCAINEFVLVVKDPPDDEVAGLKIADSAIQKPDRGTIISVGEGVLDSAVKEGWTAVFGKQVGSDHEFDGQVITCLNGNQQILWTYLKQD